MTEHVTGEEPLSKQAAADYIGVSVRQLIRLTGKGEVKHLDKRRDSEATRYSRAELDRYLGKIAPALAATVTADTHGTDGTDGTPTNNDNSQALMRRGAESVTPVTFDTGDALDTPEMRLRMLTAFEAMASPVRLTDKLMLTLTEAALLSNLSRGHLRAAIGAGKLQAQIIGRGWRVKRSDLDKYVTKL
jgi:excisionase family DNA binding protein